MNYAAIIKERVSCKEMMESVGIRVDSRGMAKCPFHGDGDASLKVYREMRRGWHCYGCNTGGDVIDFVVMWYGVGFREAIERINDDFALGLPLKTRMSGTEKRRIHDEIERKRREREAKQKACEEAEKAYWSAYEAWLENESIIANQAPRGPFDAMSEAFMDAVARKAEIKDNLNIAEERWYQARAAG